MKFTLHKPKLAKPQHYACVISGDGLWTPIAKFIADKLAKQGIPTARVKAIEYFWNKRSPQKMSDDLKAYMLRRLKVNPAAQFTFIGYSFGAGTLPFALNRLPSHLKKHIVNTILIAPPAEADFEFFFRSWLNKSTPAAKETAPEIQQLAQIAPILYVHGETDYIGARAKLTSIDSLTIISLPGGHDFNKDFGPLLATIEDFLNISHGR